MNISENKRKFSSVLLIVSLFLPLLIISPSTSYACSCAAPASAKAELERSAAVFKGKVKDVVDVKADYESKSSADQIAYIMEVDEIWKGFNETEVVVYSERDSASCGFPFVEGREYLIYAGKPNDELRASLCSRTTDLASADADLDILGEGKAPTESVTIDKKQLQGSSDWRMIDIFAVFVLGVGVLAAYFIYRSRKL